MITIQTSLERQSLMALYTSTDGDHWRSNKNWSKACPLHLWQGVDCLELSQSVVGRTDSFLTHQAPIVKLRLMLNELSGTIPKELFNLKELKHLDLSNNKLIGQIPSTIGNVVKLTELKLHYNKLEGQIPSEIGHLIQLKGVHLESNAFTGHIPDSLCNLTNLTKLNLGLSQLSGPIPAGIGKLINLQELKLNNNQLAGEIPHELGKLSHLKLIYLHKNQLTGSIPYSLGKLPHLTKLWLFDNKLTGDLPKSFLSATQLNLRIEDNLITGPLTVQHLQYLQFITRIRRVCFVLLLIVTFHLMIIPQFILPYFYGICFHDHGILQSPKHPLSYPNPSTCPTLPYPNQSTDFSTTEPVPTCLSNHTLLGQDQGPVHFPAFCKEIHYSGLLAMWFLRSYYSMKLEVIQSILSQYSLTSNQSEPISEPPSISLHLPVASSLALDLILDSIVQHLLHQNCTSQLHKVYLYSSVPRDSIRISSPSNQSVTESSHVTADRFRQLQTIIDHCDHHHHQHQQQQPTQSSVSPSVQPSTVMEVYYNYEQIIQMYPISTIQIDSLQGSTSFWTAIQRKSYWMLVIFSSEVFDLITTTPRHDNALVVYHFIYQTTQQGWNQLSKWINIQSVWHWITPKRPLTPPPSTLLYLQFEEELQTFCTLSVQTKQLPPVSKDKGAWIHSGGRSMSNLALPNELIHQLHHTLGVEYLEDLLLVDAMNLKTLNILPIWIKKLSLCVCNPRFGQYVKYKMDQAPEGELSNQTKREMVEGFFQQNDKKSVKKQDKSNNNNKADKSWSPIFCHDLLEGW